MGPEVWVGIAAVFVSGGAIGTAGTLMALWLLRKFDETDPRRALHAADVDPLRAEVLELRRRMRNIDARLEFQEQLLGGASPASTPPPRLAEPAVDVADRAAEPTGAADPTDREEDPAGSAGDAPQSTG